jgi:ketosteroid isomerase-like protein
MSEENVEMTRRALDAFNGGDLDSYLALMDGDVEAIPWIVGSLGETTVHGHEGIRRWWRDLFDVIPDLTVEVLEVWDLGEVTLVRSRYDGHGATSETPFVTTNWLCLRWRERKCVWWASKPTEAKALEAAGLSE